MQDMRNTYDTLVGKLERKTHSEDLGVDGNIRMDLRETDGKIWTGFIWLRTGASGGLL
jgi:hypothetical protein